MATIDRSVRVSGDVEEIWQKVINHLTGNRYEIESQSPYTQISAKRGSKMSSLFMEGTRGGFRELNVTLVNAEGGADVRFVFSFPSWAITLGGTRDECVSMVEEFQRVAESGTTAEVPGGASAVAASDAIVCPSCNAANPADAAFCGECGAKLEAPPAEEKKAGDTTCPKCQAALPVDAKFCAYCGNQL
jgi:ribosomal protein L40E